MLLSPVYLHLPFSSLLQDWLSFLFHCPRRFIVILRFIIVARGLVITGGLVIAGELVIAGDQSMARSPWPPSPELPFPPRSPAPYPADQTSDIPREGVGEVLPAGGWRTPGERIQTRSGTQVCDGIKSSNGA